jgi:hypothetical protein
MKFMQGKSEATFLSGGATVQPHMNILSTNQLLAKIKSIYSYWIPNNFLNLV